MDTIRGKLGGNATTPEERAKRQKQLVLPNILSLVLSTVMVVIGTQVITNNDPRTSLSDVYHTRE
jgi:hypothetical protein